MKTRYDNLPRHHTLLLIAIWHLLLGALFVFDDRTAVNVLSLFSRLPEIDAFGGEWPHLFGNLLMAQGLLTSLVYALKYDVLYISTIAVGFARCCAYVLLWQLGFSSFTLPLVLGTIEAFLHMMALVFVVIIPSHQQLHVTDDEAGVISQLEAPSSFDDLVSYAISHSPGSPTALSSPNSKYVATRILNKQQGQNEGCVKKEKRDWGNQPPYPHEKGIAFLNEKGRPRRNSQLFAPPPRMVTFFLLPSRFYLVLFVLFSLVEGFGCLLLPDQWTLLAGMRSPPLRPLFIKLYAVEYLLLNVVMLCIAWRRACTPAVYYITIVPKALTVFLVTALLFQFMLPTIRIVVYVVVFNAFFGTLLGMLFVRQDNVLLQQLGEKEIA